MLARLQKELEEFKVSSNEKEATIYELQEAKFKLTTDVEELEQEKIKMAADIEALERRIDEMQQNYGREY